MFVSTSEWNTYEHALDQDHIRLVTLSLVEGSDEAEIWGDRLLKSMSTKRARHL